MDLKQQLENKPEFQKHLFEKGFLITDIDYSKYMNRYPFYNNWIISKIGNFYFYTHKTLDLHIKRLNGVVLFLFGHAFNPFDMEYNESTILEKLITLDGDDFWNYEANLTGVYVMGKLMLSGEILHWSDCAGMRISYYGFAENHYYITSHVNLVASLCKLHEDLYIRDLRKSRYFHLFGNVLPADYSVFTELKRTVPNHTYSNFGYIKRFYPLEKITECITEKEYQSVLKESAQILKNTLEICAKKWNEKRIFISLTGGKDSGETLASANGKYDYFNYFSYVSKPEEKIDAEAAASICKNLGLDHRVLFIPEQVESLSDFELLNEIIYINGGSIGYINPNEVRKRLLLIQQSNIDLEIKSWVNEIARAYWYKKYQKTKFPKKPNGKYLATLYKVFIENRLLFLKTSKVFSDYIAHYISDDDISAFGDWTTLWSWEFGFSAGEGQSLICEHLLSYEITIPYNNRHLISLMLRPKTTDRINDRLQNDIISLNNPEQAELNISVINAAHTRRRAIIEKVYLNINSHVPF